VERKAVLGEQDLFKNAYALIAVSPLLYLCVYYNILCVYELTCVIVGGRFVTRCPSVYFHFPNVVECSEQTPCSLCFG
jgi:hypothetical protein